ncbi:C-type lectin domain family 17, member A-like [Brachyistius frenatus]|uniref:C-type lectin domain family 17, member A-like n=1 Tax=Brachyistius frenatus TaxID=100188 RepID=UPI0037E90ADB
MTEERDLLNTSLTEMTKQLDRIRTQSTEKRRSAAGLPASEDRLSSMTEERDLLNTSLTEMTKQLDRIQTQPTERKTCPEGWTMFRFSCYRLSELSGSWDTGREDCRDRAAHLVVIESLGEQLVSLCMKEGSPGELLYMVAKGQILIKDDSKVPHSGAGGQDDVIHGNWVIRERVSKVFRTKYNNFHFV